ncbi:hypothetical protein PABG_11427 [Paracoccidioides brasiliensis Pb03]|nr:hypothetical protein PABG_11427 [Paracoccidioides brasiliensis Pb03]
MAPHLAPHAQATPHRKTEPAPITSSPSPDSDTPTHHNICRVSSNEQPIPLAFDPGFPLAFVCQTLEGDEE